MTFTGVCNEKPIQQQFINYTYIHDYLLKETYNYSNLTRAVSHTVLSFCGTLTPTPGFKNPQTQTLG